MPDLHKGFVLLIDDTINTPLEATDGIGDIIKIIEKRSIPCCKYQEVPASAIFDHLHSVNFIVLDWELITPVLAGTGVSLGETVKQADVGRNIEFLKKVKANCLCPVFIFTNNNVADIINKLVKEKLYDKDKDYRNFIFIKNKSELKEEGKLFQLIDTWMNSNPAIHTLKNWENAFLKAKSGTFSKLFNINPLWSKILWDAFKTDQVNESSNLNEIIYRNVKSQTSHIELDQSIIASITDENLDLEEIKNVITGATYIDNVNIPIDDIQPGDIFKIEKDTYYINFRPVCDTVPKRSQFDGYVYCLKGVKLSSGQVEERHDEDYNMLIDKTNEVILYGVDGKNFVSFSLKAIFQFKFEDIKEKRIQRLLPPYANYVQQTAGAYTQRVGLPRIPVEIIEKNRKTGVIK